MEHTRDEIVQRALRLIGVCAADEPATADQAESGLAVLESIWAELRGEAQATWDIATGTPSAGFVPLANLLAAEMAPEYGVAAPMSRARAKLRLLSVIRVREDNEDCCRDDYGFPIRGARR